MFIINLYSGIDINQPEGTGVTPVITTAQFGQPLTMAWLINKGANYHVSKYVCNLSLHIAYFAVV